MANRSIKHVVTIGALKKAPIVTSSCVEPNAIRAQSPVTYFVTSFFLVIVFMFVSLANASEQVFAFDISQQRADGALTALADQADISVVFDYDAVRQYQASQLKGRYKVQTAVELLLANTQLNYQFESSGHLIITLQNHSDGDDEMNSKKKLLASLVGFFVGSGTQAVFAQDEGSSSQQAGSGWAVEEIVVTAQKRSQSVKDVPIAIDVLGAGELQERGIANFEDLGLAVPGLTVQDTADQRQIAIRGVNNLSGKSPMTGVYVDEMPALGGESGFGKDLPDLRLYDLERVEVLKGPQGTLYGQGSMGGTVRFITKKPDLEEFGVRADVGASFTKGGEASQSVKGVLNIPVIAGELGFRIAGTFATEGGWIDQPVAQQENINDSNITNVRIKGLWSPSDVLEVDAMAIIHQRDGGLGLGEDDNGDFRQGFNQPLIPTVDDSYEAYNLTVNYDLGEVSLISSSSYMDKSNDNLNRGGLIDFGFTQRESLVVSNPVDSKIFNQEVRLLSNGNSPFQWLVGAAYKDMSTDQIFSSLGGALGDPLPPLSTLSPSRLQSESKAWAVFGNVSYAITDQLEIGAGSRYFEDDREFIDALGVQGGTFDSVSPRFYMNYKLSDDAMIYASVAKGFRSGDFNALGQPPFEPEIIWTYEIGTKASLFDAHLETEIALFYSDYSDFVVNGQLPPPNNTVAIFSNSGDAEIKGVDLALTWQASDPFSLSVNGTYTDAEIVSLGGVTGGGHSVGDPLDGIAKYSFTVSSNYDFEISNRPGFFRLDYNYQSKVSRSLRFVNLFLESGVIGMLNGRVGWEVSDNLSLALFARNLLNERDNLEPNGQIGISVRPRPRTIGFELGADF